MNQETGRRKQETSEEKVFRKQEALYERLVQLGASVQHLSNNLQRMAEMSARVNAAMLMLVGLPRHFAFGFRSMLFHGAAGSAGPFKGGYGNSGFLPRGVSQAAGFGGKSMSEEEYLKNYERVETEKKRIWDKIHMAKRAEEKEKENTEAENPNVFLGGKKKKKPPQTIDEVLTKEQQDEYLKPKKTLALDTETFGKEAGEKLPLEIFAQVKDELGNIVEGGTFHEHLLYAKKQIPPEATDLHGLYYSTDEKGNRVMFHKDNPDEAIDAISPKAAAKKYKEFLEKHKDAVITGYNVPFDVEVMENLGEMTGNDMPVTEGISDTSVLAKALFPNLKGGHSLQNVAESVLDKDILQGFIDKGRLEDSGHNAQLDVALDNAVREALTGVLRKRIAEEQVAKSAPPPDVGKGTQNPPPPKPPAPPASPSGDPEDSGPFVGPVHRPWATDDPNGTGGEAGRLRRARYREKQLRGTSPLEQVFDKLRLSGARLFQEQAKATKSPFWREMFLAGRHAMFHPGAAVGMFSEWSKKFAMPTMYAGAAAGSLLSAASPDAYATLTGSVKMLAISIGRHLIPLAATLSIHLQKWAVSLYKGDSIFGSLTAKIIAATAIGGLVITVLGSLASSVLSVIGVLKTLGFAGSGAAVALGLIAMTAVNMWQQHDERLRAVQAESDAASGKGTPGTDTVKLVDSILSDKNLTTEQKRFKLLELEEFQRKNFSDWADYSARLDREIADNPLRLTQTGIRNFIGSIPGVGEVLSRGIGQMGADTSTRPGGQIGLLNQAGLRGLTPTQAQAEARTHSATAISDLKFVQEATKTLKLPAVSREKQLQENIMKGNQTLMAIQSIRGTPQYSSVEEAYKRVQVAALSEDPLTSLLNKWQIELGKLFAEQLAQQKDGNNILADILGAFFK